jgi:DNA-binding NarL/FixJ family response regulator
MNMVEDISSRKARKRKPSTKKIFIVEDHPVFREGLRQLVNREAEFTVCGESDTCEQALKAIRSLEPDLVLVDLTLPGKSGLQLLKEVRAFSRKIKLLVVSMHDQALYADRVLRAGGDGYIMKQEDPSEIIHAIRDVLDGHIYISEEVMAASAKAGPKPEVRSKGGAIDQLTDSELEVLEMLGRGRSDEEISQKLSLSDREIGTQVAQIQKKLKLSNTNALIRYAVCWVEKGVTGT